MSAPVNVLAVLDDYWRRHDIPKDLYLVRTTVAELIDLLDEAYGELSGDGHRDGPRSLLLTRMESMRARVGGEA